MFLSCGDALFDLFSVRDHASTSAPTAVTLSGNVGGSPMNVVVGLARMGTTRVTSPSSHPMCLVQK